MSKDSQNESRYYRPSTSPHSRRGGVPSGFGIEEPLVAEKKEWQPKYGVSEIENSCLKTKKVSRKESGNFSTSFANGVFNLDDVGSQKKIDSDNKKNKSFTGQLKKERAAKKGDDLSI